VSLLNHDENGTKLAQVRLAKELFSGHRRPGESVKLSEFATQYQLDEASVLAIFREFQTLGIVLVVVI